MRIRKFVQASYQEIFRCFFLTNLAIVFSFASGSQPLASDWNKEQLTLSNGIIKRVIKLPVGQGSYSTAMYSPLTSTFLYFEKVSPDFQFELNNRIYSGAGKWSVVSIQNIQDGHQGKGASVTLISSDRSVEVSVNYLMYPRLPLIRKSLSIKNLGGDSVALESVDIEKLSVTSYYPSTYSWVFSDYGRRRSLGPYEGNKQDALVIVHNPEWKQGILLGNEASGVLKRTSVFWEAPEICIGLTHKDALFPFRKWIAPGESFVTPQVFSMVYDNQKDISLVLNSYLPDFIRRHLGIRLSDLAEKPTFVYNTWHPFKSDINEKLIMKLAEAAAAAGMKEFVIDDGWQDKLGDWGVNKEKFPNGIKPVFDYIKSLGMKPGLWVSIGTAAPDSKVYQDHPEWFVVDKTGGPISLVIADNDKYTACLGTGFYGHIRNILKRLSLEYGLEYLKLDFSVVSSPYRFNHTESGCYAVSHPGHKDHHESMFTNYEFMWALFDELHKSKPSLFIDCTFETMGGLQLIDYAMLKHAEGNWLSNFYESDEAGDLRVRNMAWWRSPAMSATALVIGNLDLSDKAGDMHVKSLAGALPILLGDPRKLTPEALKKFSIYSTWFQAMNSKHDIVSYRQDLSGFGEPAEGGWDGFQRINTETGSGGIVGVFRHGSAENKRAVIIKYLDPNRLYVIKEAISGKVVLNRVRGKKLNDEGFFVSIESRYGGELFEVSSLKSQFGNINEK